MMTKANEAGPRARLRSATGDAHARVGDAQVTELGERIAALEAEILRLMRAPPRQAD